MLRLLKCNLDGETATRRMENIAIGSHGLYRNDAICTFTDFCREVFNDRWESVYGINTGLVFFHLRIRCWWIYNYSRTCLKGGKNRIGITVELLERDAESTRDCRAWVRK